MMNNVTITPTNNELETMLKIAISGKPNEGLGKIQQIILRLKDNNIISWNDILQWNDIVQKESYQKYIQKNKNDNPIMFSDWVTAGYLLKNGCQVLKNGATLLNFECDDKAYLRY
ncbi:hypothetical protein SY212_19720 [Ligilactobacillus agilis]|uniref:Uncharacterized protein n=1 Tax=Ligilactobacillus agilis TaxID=1601 RepID=A0A6F9XNW8_9LACO|nr:hypothetical protein [Ligilactobacillus agilis]GET06942.1 hypothetical protein SY212_19720 [Ligilactobacillus agilis]